MKNAILLIIFGFSLQFGFSQNVGQEGDTLLNYKDINGLKQGPWKKYFENGNPMYEVYFVDDRPVGEYKRYDKRGFLTTLMICDSLTDHAHATFYYSDGRMEANGNYVGKNKDSIWNYYDGTGILYLQESYKNGVKDGAFRQYTSEKVLIEEINWKDGQKNGSWKKFYVEGPLMWEANYVNGKVEGNTKAYYKSGKLYKEGAFKNDLMDGTWTRYNENGSINKIYHFKDGVSPEAAEENDSIMKVLYNNKGKYDEPRNANDIDWLRSNPR